MLVKTTLYSDMYGTVCYMLLSNNIYYNFATLFMLHYTVLLLNGKLSFLTCTLSTYSLDYFQ